MSEFESVITRGCKTVIEQRREKAVLVGIDRPGSSWPLEASLAELSRLVDAGFLYRCPAGYLLPYAKPSNKGLFEVKDFIAANGHFGQQTIITPQGKALLRMLLHEN